MKRILELWRVLLAPSGRYSILVLLVAGGLGGVIFWGGFNTFMEYTNTMHFCTSCHEMRSTVFQEYKKTIHYRNPSGVQAICSDCHVPKPWLLKLQRKIYATNELFHFFLGTIDTPEKFEANRLEMASNVWRQMKETDSRECRNCHNFAAMELAAQAPRARGQHEDALATGETCIDCHKGIAHKKPVDPDEAQAEAEEEEDEGFMLED